MTARLPDTETGTGKPSARAAGEAGEPGRWSGKRTGNFVGTADPVK